MATDTYGTPDASRWKMEFVYDGRGRMRIRKDYIWLTGAWYPNGEQRYVYDGMRLLQQRSSGNVPQVSYTRGLDLSGSLEGAGGIGGLLARSTHATISPHALNSTAYYHADGNGNITYLLRSDAAANASYKYDPFGRLLSSSGSLATANVMRFSSKPILLSSQGTWGDYYYGYRFYDPESQRWLNRDPIQERGGVNLFAYCGSQPTTLIDPYGFQQAFFNPMIEGLAAPFVAECMKAIQSAFDVKDESDNDKRNHCVASCRLANACGEGIAEWLGHGKEARDLSAGFQSVVLTKMVVMNPLIQIFAPDVSNSTRENIDEMQGHGVFEAWADEKANAFGRVFASCGLDCVSSCEVVFGP